MDFQFLERWYRYLLIDVVCHLDWFQTRPVNSLFVRIKFDKNLFNTEKPLELRYMRWSVQHMIINACVWLAALFHLSVDYCLDKYLKAKPVPTHIVYQVTFMIENPLFLPFEVQQHHMVESCSNIVQIAFIQIDTFIFMLQLISGHRICSRLDLHVTNSIFFIHRVFNRRVPLEIL